MLSNHIHLVLRNRPDVVETWSDQDVIRRWLTITRLAKSRDGQIQEPSVARMALEFAIPGRLKVLRLRLSDPSWFMGILCEYTSRRCNREDGCKGRFWEDRFGCRYLADDAAVLICGIYVDLNQIRAGEAITPETSRHTSAFDRILACQQRQRCQSGCDESLEAADGWMCELTLDEGAYFNDPRERTSTSNRRASDKGLLPIGLDTYLQLLDCSGRIITHGTTGSIPAHLQPILDRLGIRSEVWSMVVTGFDQVFGLVVGAPARLAQHAAATGRRWLRGQSKCSTVFISPSIVGRQIAAG